MRAGSRGQDERERERERGEEREGSRELRDRENRSASWKERAAKSSTHLLDVKAA
jgi:hypothetical protein